jgi:hypothetical protein
MVVGLVASVMWLYISHPLSAPLLKSSHHVLVCGLCMQIMYSLSHLLYKMSHIVWLQNYGGSKVDHVCFVS